METIYSRKSLCEDATNKIHSVGYTDYQIIYHLDERVFYVEFIKPISQVNYWYKTEREAIEAVMNGEYPIDLEAIIRERRRQKEIARQAAEQMSFAQ